MRDRLSASQDSLVVEDDLEFADQSRSTSSQDHTHSSSQDEDCWDFTNVR